MKENLEPLPPGIWKIAAVAALGSFLAQIDSTVVNVSLSSLATELRTTLATVQWVSSGYLLALALMLPLNGWLVDRVGVRRLYLWCFTAFTLASALCAAAWSVDSLICFRVLQGMAGGLLAPMAQMILARAAGKHMARVIGYAAMPVLLGPILGPVIAGAILQHLTWHWLFLVNVPAGALGVLLAVRFLPRDDDQVRPRTFDLAGFALLAPGLVLLLYGADHLSERTGLACITTGLALLLIFGRMAWRKGEHALIDLRLFREGVFPVTARIQFLQNGIVYATQLLLPLYLLRVCARSPAQVGLLLVPLGLGMVVVYPSMGALTRRLGLRNTAAAGAAISLLSALLLLFVARYRAAGAVFALTLFVRGMGQGGVSVPSISAAYGSVPKSDLPMATTAMNIVQRLGGPVFTTLMATFLAWRLHAAPAAPAASFMIAFAVLAALHALLLLFTMQLPATMEHAAAMQPSRKP